MIIGLIGKSRLDITSYIYRAYDLREAKESELLFTLINGTIVIGILEHEDVAGHVFDKVEMTPAYTSLLDYARSKLRSK